MKSILAVLSIILFTVACTPRETTDSQPTTINIADNIGRGELIKLSEIAESIHYIPLQTNDSTLLGTITSLYYNNGYFLPKTARNSAGKFLIFDKSGLQQGTLSSKGRGPGEYVGVYDIDIYKEIIVILSENTILEYTVKGEHLKSVSLTTSETIPGYSRVIKLDDDHYLLATQVNFTAPKNYSAIIADSDGKAILLFDYPESEVELAKNRRGYTKGLNTPMIFANAGIGKVITGENENILTHDTNFKNVDTLYKIKYGKYHINPDNIESVSGTSELLSINYPILESDNFLFLNLNLNALAHKPMLLKKGSAAGGGDILMNTSFALFDKRNGTFSLIDQTAPYQKGFVEDFEGGPAFWPNHVSNDNYMVSFVNAPDFIEHAQNNKVSPNIQAISNNLKETDNPVMVLVKLR